MSEFDPLQSAWTKQKEEPFAMSLADIHQRAARFQTRVRGRNLIEYGASAFVMLAFAGIAIMTPDWGLRAAAALVIAGVAYVCWKLSTTAGAVSKDPAQTWTAFHRAELVRQHAALSSVWRWYLGPLVPGMLAVIAVSSLARGEIPWIARAAVALIGIVWVTVIFYGVAWINKKGAEKIQAEIDALDRARDG